MLNSSSPGKTTRGSLLPGIVLPGKRSRQWLAALLLALLSACSSVPFDYPKRASHALPADPSTALGELSADWRARHGSKAGLVGLGSGIDALGARLRALELAERSVDAQYFILKKDRAGTLFALGLLSAADRGVRVRLLIDDIFSPGVDEAFTLLSSHPNIEIRIFNPLSRSTPYLNYLTDFSRANRRMHNKSFTVDNSLSIVGGRNIAEEYFEINQDVQFDDYEVMLIGDTVEAVSAGFDAFWNSELSVPVEAFEETVDYRLLERWRQSLDETLSTQGEGLYAQALASPLLARLRGGELAPVAAEVSLFTDTPEKILADVGDREQAVLAVEFARRLRNASDEVIIVTPYYVPQELGAEGVEKLLARGVRVVIVTNSLASTNHVAVHSGYARYRKRLLEAGARIYEIRADQVGDENAWGHTPASRTLHSKATTIDRETIFIGSLNFDPRSIYINTEMGLFIDSGTLGGGFTERLIEELAAVTWRVELDERGRLRWVYDHGGQRLVEHKEPGTSWWRRFQVSLYRLLPIESQL